MMEKTCPVHGEFKDCVYSDVALYLKMEEWEFGDNKGLSNPAMDKGAEAVCPDDCGLCSLHTSHSALANVDLTNRCNLTCPVCFANANSAGYLYEPDMEQVRTMLNALRNERPVDGRVVQFSGGEPTIHPKFIEILAMAKEMGFTHLQAATNGILIAGSLEFAKKCKEAGLATLYLQFDGVTDDIYLKTRGEALVEMKMRCIENCRAAGMKIVFVPTIVKGLNDHQLGDILKVAIDNVDTVSGISFQPVAFTGRISKAGVGSQALHPDRSGICPERPDGNVRQVQRLVPAIGDHAVQQADCGGGASRCSDDFQPIRTARWELTCSWMRIRARRCR